MRPAHPLDRPVWDALASGWAQHAIGDHRARRIDPAYNVFGAAADPSAESQQALAALIRRHGELWVVEPAPWPAPPDCVVVRSAIVAQMLCHSLPPTARVGSVPLGDADAADMRALVALTQPGPFAAGTHRIGGFIGVRDGGRLVAMAGERMRSASHAEVSGVCTDPAWRGRGLAAALIAEVAARIAARGQVAWLTSYAANTRAIALYEALGFATRRTMTLTVFAPAI